MSAGNRLQRAGTRFQGQAYHFQRALRLRAAAHENIRRGEAEFRPGMDRYMRFRQQHDAGHALSRAEGMEMAMQDLRAGGECALPKQLFDGCGVGQFRLFDTVQIGQQMGAGGLIGFHLWPPLEPLPQLPPLPLV